jgi:hypothetical protein
MHFSTGPATLEHGNHLECLQSACAKLQPKTNLVRTSLESSAFKACEGLDKRIDQSMRTDFKPPNPEYGPSQAAATGNNDGDLDLYN